MIKLEDHQLRNLTERDLGLVLRWRNSPDIRKNMYNDHIITIDEHRSWFNGLQSDTKRNYQIFTDRKTPLGLVGFTDIDVTNSHCTWTFYLGETGLPKGTGTVLGYLALQYVYNTLNLKNVYGEVIIYNEASIKFHDRLGFVQVDRYPQYAYKNGTYHDVLLFNQNKEKWELKKRCVRAKY